MAIKSLLAMVISFLSKASTAGSSSPLYFSRTPFTLFPLIISLNCLLVRPSTLPRSALKAWQNPFNIVAKVGRSQAKAVKGVAIQARATRTRINNLAAVFIASLLVLFGRTLFIVKISFSHYPSGLACQCFVSREFPFGDLTRYIARLEKVLQASDVVRILGQSLIPH